MVYFIRRSYDKQFKISAVKLVMEDNMETHESKINNHSERLYKLEQDNRELKTEIKNLCENLKSNRIKL